MKHLGYIGFLFLLSIPAMSFSQEKNKFIFFEKQAWKDAKTEQQMIVIQPEDELDFWKDQLGFEEILKKDNLAAYQVYINGKSEAYRKHAQDCSKTCQHGTQYYLKATFYHANAVKKEDKKNPLSVITPAVLGID